MIKFVIALSSTVLLALPINIVSKSQRASVKPLVESKNYIVTKKDLASFSEFKDLHFVNLYNLKTTISDLSQYGEVKAYKKGELAVMVFDESASSRLSGKLHGLGQYCGSIIKIDGHSQVRVVDAQPIVPVRDAHKAVVNALKKVDPANIRQTVEELSENHNRYHTSETGLDIATNLHTYYNKFVGSRDDVEITTFDHGSVTQQDSLLIRIKGQKKPEEIVVLGSHIDSISGWFFPSGNRAPGADDNASGTATNIEIFRILMESGMTFDRTIEIHGYAAEEVGLYGSADMAKKYSRADKKVVSMMQIDMDIYAPEGEEKIWFISNGTDTAMNSNLMSLVDNYLDIPHSTGPLYMGTSDHASWMRYDYPASFPTENPNDYNSHIHTEDDDIEHSGNFFFASQFAKLGIAYLSHYAGFSED